MCVWQDQGQNLHNNLSTTNVGKGRMRRRWRTFGWTKNKFRANDWGKILTTNCTSHTCCTAHTFCMLFYGGYDRYLTKTSNLAKNCTFRTHRAFCRICALPSRRTKHGYSMLPTWYIYIPGNKTEYILSYIHY